MNKYNVWNKWDKLKTVMLGQCYTSDFFRDIENSRTRSALQRIADETLEDLDYYESVLKDFGCCVLRPQLDNNENIMSYISDTYNSQVVPRSPLQPRDTQFVLGNNIYYTGHDHHAIKQELDNYNNLDRVDWCIYDEKIHGDLRHLSEEKFNQVAGKDWKSYYEYKNDPNYFEKIDPAVATEILDYNFVELEFIQSPSYTLVGRDLYVDCGDHELHDFQTKSIIEKNKNLRFNVLNHGGHSDGCFHTLKPGVMLSLYDIQTYKNTFPDWDVCYLPDQSVAKISGFLKLKNQVGGKWWVPGEENNNEFTHFVETWLQDWVGYVEETVFDVNVLVLDEHHVCVNNMNPIVIEFLKKHNMEPVHVPWRHRYFWDGGLHCITLDLEREGVQEDYFPERGDAGIIDYGFD